MVCRRGVPDFERVPPVSLPSQTDGIVASFVTSRWIPFGALSLTFRRLENLGAMNMKMV